MKKYITTTVLAIGFLSFQVDAQQLSQFDQFAKYNFVLNPGSTGMENYTDISANYRRQWTGFENAPKSFILSVNSRMLETTINDTKAPPSIFISNNDLYNNLEKSEAVVTPTPHAFGGYLMTDRNGPFEKLSGFFNYAYHLKVSKEGTLSFGVGVGYSRRELKVNTLDVVSQNDQTFANYQASNTNTSYFDASAGLTYYKKNYFIGYGVNQLNRTELYDEIEGGVGKLTLHHNFSGGYIINLTENLELFPTIMVRVIDPSPTEYDASLRLRIDKSVWFGGGYRHDDAVSAQFGLTLYNKLNIGYSYAFSTSEIRNSNDGSHEISIGVMLNNGVVAPTKMW